MKLVTAATIENITTRRDNTLKVTIGTQELGPEEEAKLFQFRNKVSKILFSDDNINQEMIDAVSDAPISYEEAKTPSQKQRAKIYVWYEKRFRGHENKPEFKEFYRNIMDRHMDRIQEKIDELD
jgi:ssDNA-specific exonuclease RecJ